MDSFTCATKVAPHLRARNATKGVEGVRAGPDRIRDPDRPGLSHAAS
jgi:hypothetical protein